MHPFEFRASAAVEGRSEESKEPLEMVHTVRCFFCFFFWTDMSITTKRRLFFSSVGRLLFSRRRFLCRELIAMMLGGCVPFVDDMQHTWRLLQVQVG